MKELHRSWRCKGEELLEVRIEQCDLDVERVDPLRKGAERELRGIQRSGQVAGRDPKSRADRSFAAQRLAIGQLVGWLTSTTRISCSRR
jgi:hypothetical protein